MFPMRIVLTVFHLDVSDQFSLMVGFQARDVLAVRNSEKGRTRPFKQYYSKTLKIRSWIFRSWVLPNSGYSLIQNKCGVH